MEFVNGNIFKQIALVQRTKWAQKIAQPRPHAFFTVGMDFKPTNPIVITRPFPHLVTHRFPNPLERVLALILVGIDQRFRLRKLLGEGAQSQALDLVHHPQAEVSGLPPQHAQDRRSVIGVSPPSPTRVGMMTRVVERVEMLSAFFPPRISKTT